MDNMMDYYKDLIKNASLEGTCVGKEYYGYKVEDCLPVSTFGFTLVMNGGTNCSEIVVEHIVVCLVIDRQLRNSIICIFAETHRR